MAKFDLSKKNEKQTSKRRKRKVSRKKTSIAKEERKQLNLELIPTSEKWPPQNDTRQILTWENRFGWIINNSELARQHIERDIQMFGYSRVRYWTFLE
jgi:hypothetical protein